VHFLPDGVYGDEQDHQVIYLVSNGQPIRATGSQSKPGSRNDKQRLAI
jgi:hypothetical protein